MNWKPNELLFVPLGGAGEIGMNVNLYHYQGKWLMVDLGINFPDENMPGVDVVLPDLRFLDDKIDDIAGLVLTHGHEDHLGAVPYLWRKLRCPVYGTPFTLALLRAKLKEHGLASKVPLNPMPYNTPTDIAPFSVEMLALTHSIPDAAGLIISVAGKQIFHTGDWKFDPSPQLGGVSDMQRLKALGDAGVLAMIGDSTNAMVEGTTPSEETAKAGLLEAIKKQKGRVAITCFASNVARLNSLIEVAGQVGREVMLVGRALNRAVLAAEESGYLKDWPTLLDVEDFESVPRDKLLLIASGSQGEARSSMTRIGMGTHHLVGLESGDCVLFSSREIPGNESAIAKVAGALVARGIKVIDADDAPIHVSGHPARGDLTAMYQMIRPQIAIPVHGTPRYIQAHVELAQNCQVPYVAEMQNGQVIRLHPAPPKRIGEAEIGMQTREGKDIIPLYGSGLKGRRKLMEHGTISASLVLDGKGRLVASPLIHQSGVMDDEKASDFTAEAMLALEDACADLNKNIRDNDAQVESIVAKTLRSLAKKMAGRRPVVHIHILRV